MAIFNMTGGGDVSDIKTFGSSHIKIVDVCLNYLSRGWDSYNDDLVETGITPSELAPHDYGLLVISSADKMYGEKDGYGVVDNNCAYFPFGVVTSSDDEATLESIRTLNSMESNVFYIQKNGYVLRFDDTTIGLRKKASGAYYFAADSVEYRILEKTDGTRECVNKVLYIPMKLFIFE